MRSALTNLGDLVNREGRMDSPAIIDLREEAPRITTHMELDRLANGVARYLTDMGFRRGSSVAILSQNRMEYLAAYFGIMRAGFVAVPVNTKQPIETIRFVLEDSAAVFAFVDQGGLGQLPEGIACLEFDATDSAGFTFTINPGEFTTVTVAPTDTAQILYTSGSTGRPKGVELSHGSQLWALSTRTPKDTVKAQNEVYIIAQPLFHMNGLFGAKQTIAHNATLVLLPGFDERRYLFAMADHRVTAVTAVPTMFARLLKHPDLLESLDFSSLKNLVLASAPITEAMSRRIAAAFPAATLGHGYGTTEAGPAVFGPHPEGKPTPELSVGFPIQGSQSKLVDGATPDEGVLMMRNPALMTGYRGMPEKTASVINDGWYYSGDVMRRDADGFYYFVGRADDMFVCAGENIYPSDVEKMLEGHPGVSQVSIVPLPDEERGQVPVAFIVRSAGSEVTAEDIKTFALANGPTYQYPRRVAFVPELVLAGTNKIDRNALIRRARELESEQGWESSRAGQA